MITSFEQLFQHLLQHKRRVRVALCQPSDAHSIQAIARAVQMGFAEGLLVGDVNKEEFEKTEEAVKQHLTIVKPSAGESIAATAVRLVREGKADILMKGLINTDVLMRAILNKSGGLRPPHAVITHLVLTQLPQWQRLLLVTDVAVIPYPDLQQRWAQLEYAIAMARRLGIAIPKVAMLHCNEQVSEKFPVTLDYVHLKERLNAGALGEVIVDAPLDLACAISPHALYNKQISSPIEGAADILVLPDIQAGNVLYKCLQCFFPDAPSAALLCGTSHPVVLTSRGDSVQSKVNSLALAALQLSEIVS